ncbi:chorismate mutase [Bacillus sp. HMF5848]|uniref:chorismate mutase n=1 Tax=Bacillus sp. HMF5848 TaxID=2495421 RepID=UPI000F797B1C|nr:chorismate mutase [Bacillus sp. HMF5848]RSK27429.1 chorismate mutase [Bacillus sp. HMF5848]
MLRGIRGATTVRTNTKAEIVSVTERLLQEMIVANSIEANSVSSVLISVTNDVTAEFPAKALRNIEGWTYVPVMCMQEIPVPDSLSMCIRVMIMVDTQIAQQDIRHIYLEGATNLRPDLNIDNS